MIPSLFNQSAYSGGPFFDKLSSVCFDLEDITLELTLPESDAKRQDPPRSLNFPFNTPGWFEANSKRPNLRAWVHVYTKIWYYFPLRLKRLVNLMAMGANGPMGDLSIGVHINKVQGGKKLDLSNPCSLADYIKWEYDSYYESPEVGDYGKGQNYEVRTEYGRRLAQYGESYRDQYNAALESELEPVPDRCDQMEFGGGRWTGFNLKRLRHMSTQYYCIPLSEFYYLHINIQLHFDLDKYRAVIGPDMLSAAEWLVQHIKITFPGKPEGPLALPR
jgi:hypothetical protein